MSIATRIQSMYENVGEVYDTITNVTLPEHKNIENIPSTIRKSYLEIMNNGIDVVWDNWEKVVGEGTSLTLSNTEQAPMKVLLKGNTYQDSTTGKNLFNINGTPTNTACTYSISNNELTQTNSGAYSRTLWTISNLTIGQTYTLSFSYKNSNSSSIEAMIRNSADTTTIANTTATTNTSGTETLSFTATETTHNIRFYSNITNTSNTSVVIFSNIQLEVGSQATSYEPYTNGASPNPDYPQDVHVVTGDNTIKVEGKNVLSISSVKGYGYNFGLPDIETQLMVIDSYNANNITYHSTASNYLMALTNIIKLKPNTTYTLSYKRTTTATNNQVFVYDYDGLKYSINQRDNNTNLPKITFTTNNIGNIALAFGYAQATGTTTISDIQIEKGSTATTYEAYTGTTYPINLPVKNLFDKDNVVKVDNKILNDSGTEINDSTGGYTKMYIPVKPNTEYTISGLSSSGSKRIYFFNSSKTFISRTAGFTATYTTITTPNNCYFLDIQYYISGNDFNTYQVELGNKVNSFTPYGTTPIELCKIGTYQDRFFKTSGKNLYNKAISTFDGYVTNDGTEVQSANYKTSDYIPIEPNTTYVTGVMTNSGNNPSRCYYDENKIFISGEKHFGATTIVGTSPNNAKYMRESIPVVDIDKVQIEEGTTATSYEPYGNGDWFLEKKIGKVVLDGSESWSYTNNSFRKLQMDINTDDRSNPNLCSNYYLGVPYSASWGNYSYMISNTLDKYMVIKNIDYTNVTDFKTWLSTHNTIVYYILATPTYTKIEGTLASQLEEVYRAKSEEGQTNISQTNNDLPFVLDVSALKEI